jgi:hypothetical protein
MSGGCSRTSVIIRCVEPINRDRGRGGVALKFVQSLLPVNFHLPLRGEAFHETPPLFGVIEIKCFRLFPGSNAFSECFRPRVI